MATLGKTQGKTMIHVDGLTKNYGLVTAVNGISFDVHAGEVLGFLGPNGAGKTTTMKILTSFLAPTQGRAQVAGYDVFEQSLEARAHIGYLPEGTPLYRDMTVLEYLNFMADMRNLPTGQGRNRRLRQVVEMCGIETYLGFLIGELSKGFRQRVGLAQAILHEPEVLVLDEPTAGLDPNQLREIRPLIKNIGADKTVIFSTHIMQEVEAICSRIIIIAAGQIVAQGAPEALKDAQTAEEPMRLVAALRGTPAELSDALRQVEGVAQVDADDSAGQEIGTHRFVLVAANPGIDLRERVLKMAAQKGLVLTELTWKRASLEDVFCKKTMSVQSQRRRPGAAKN